MALFIFLIKGWYKDATFSPVSYVIGTILFLFLSFQCIMRVGSLKILDTTDFYESEISEIVNHGDNNTNIIPTEQAGEVIQMIIDRFPLLHHYIGGGEFTGFTAIELPHAIADELRSFMHWYIFRRILWCLGFVIVGAICVIKSLSSNRTPLRSLRQSERPSKQYAQIERRRIRRTRK